MAAQRRTKECPICKQIVSRRRNVIEGVGQCPHCGATLYAYHTGRGSKRRTLWVSSSGGCKEIVELAEDYIRGLDGMAMFSFGRGETFKMELNCAKTLLDMCEGEYDVAARVLQAFYDRRVGRAYGIWYVPKSLRGVIASKGPIRVALAYAMESAPSQQAPQQFGLAELAAG